MRWLWLETDRNICEPLGDKYMGQQVLIYLFNKRHSIFFYKHMLDI